MNSRDLIVGVLMISLVMGGGLFLINDFGTGTETVPGDEQGIELQARITEYANQVKDITESPASAAIGILGLAGLIKLVILDAPIYAGGAILEMLASLGLPGAVGAAMLGVLITYVIHEAILLLRGVRS